MKDSNPTTVSTPPPPPKRGVNSMTLEPLELANPFTHASVTT